MKISISRLALACAVAAASPAIAMAQTTGAASTQAAPLAPPPPITFAGITLYGTIDTGLAWQSHGVPLDSTFAPGLEYVISKNSGKSRFSLAPNALSQSKFGIKVNEPIDGDLSYVALAEMQFVPTSGQLVDGLNSVVRNNGRPAAQQSSNGDSSKDGELFAGQAYMGLSSKTWGTLTAGRHWSLMLDNIVAYDPLTASHAFSILGYQGAAQAGAATEDARLDRSIKYQYRTHGMRLSGLYQFGATQGPNTRAYGADIGGDLKALSVDATYMHVNDSVAAALLTPAQYAVLPHDTLAGSVSDNDAYAVFAKYTLPRAKLFAGVESIRYRNPKVPLTAGYDTEGGYVLSVVNNAAFPHPKQLTYAWLGVRYAVTPRLDLSAAYYHVGQNSYAAVKCADTSSAQCRGQLAAVTLLADYKLSNRVDVYAGAMYSHVAGGLASGFLNTSTVDPMVGLRFNF